MAHQQPKTYEKFRKELRELYNSATNFSLIKIIKADRIYEFRNLLEIVLKYDRKLEVKSGHIWKSIDYDNVSPNEFMRLFINNLIRIKTESYIPYANVDADFLEILNKYKLGDELKAIDPHKLLGSYWNPSVHFKYAGIGKDGNSILVVCVDTYDAYFRFTKITKNFYYLQEMFDTFLDSQGNRFGTKVTL